MACKPRPKATLDPFPAQSKQNVCSLRTMLPPSEFPRRVADATNAGNEDHAHRRQLRHHLRVMSGTARQSTTREAESSCSSFNGFLQVDIRIRWLVGRAGGKIDRSLCLCGDICRAQPYSLGKQFQLLGRKIAEFNREAD